MWLGGPSGRMMGCGRRMVRRAGVDKVEARRDATAGILTSAKVEGLTDWLLVSDHVFHFSTLPQCAPIMVPSLIHTRSGRLRGEPGFATRPWRCAEFSDRELMADVRSDTVVSSPAEASAIGRNGSVRIPDLTGKGKSTEASGSPSAAAGDKVAEMMGRLNLTSQEANAFILEDEDEEYPNCPEWAVVGKVLAPNPLHINTIKSVLRLAWGNPKGLEFHSTGANLFMAEFATQADRDRMLVGSPWNINKNGVLLKLFDPAVKPRDVCFDKLLVWARIFNLPFGPMNDIRGKSLASNIGDVVKMEVDGHGRAWGDFLRVRVWIKTHEPLMRFVSVFSQKRQTTEVYQVMYECLPTFCFSCGLLGHSSGVCPNPGERDEEGLLPYHGMRLCVPEERKKQSDSKSGQSSFSSNRPAPAAAHHGPSNPNQMKKGGGGSGDVSSPKKLRKPRTTRTATTPSSAAGAMKGFGTSVQKDSGGVSPLRQGTVSASILAATEDGGSLVVEEADPNKRQKTVSPSKAHRSADQAEAAAQPCRTQ
uniref:Uncharacterized protein n=1 Tax=Avena sativa TaxID=4498 RepID=A0ACD5VWU6_AVESA